MFHRQLMKLHCKTVAWTTIALLFSVLSDAVWAQPQSDHFVPSRPETLSWGWFPIDKPPILTVTSGDTVFVDTLSHAGSTQRAHPVESLGELGVEASEILQDVIDFWDSRDGRPREGRSGHVITGPIAIAGAEPGDTLEVQVLDLTTRAPYGSNNTGPTSGVFARNYPGTRPTDPQRDIENARHLYRTITVDGREMALFSDDIRVP